MKEIDFLPQWYKSGKRREAGYRTQYIALVGIFVVMTVWNFAATRSISKVRATFAQMSPKQVEAESASVKLDKVKGKMAALKKKAEALEKIDSKIDVARVLAEISFLIDEKIVLSKVEFSAEKFEEEQEGKAKSGALIRVVRARMDENRALPLGNVRFKVVINGVAADASNVAKLICKLEDSPYFCQVIPSFSRNTEITMGSGSSLNSRGDLPEEHRDVKGRIRQAQGGLRASEFEISCYLANYRED